MFWYGPHGGWGWAMGPGSLVFWVLAAVVIAALARMFMRGRFDGPQERYGGQAYGGQSYGASAGPYDPAGPAPWHTAWPEQILAQRLARGDISRDEFREQMAALHAETPHPGNPTDSFS
jgi:uncharacterized membrane protein